MVHVMKYERLLETSLESTIGFWYRIREHH